MNTWKRPSVRSSDTQRLAIARQCTAGIRTSITDPRQQSHEGIVYLLGMSDSSSTIAVSAITPHATTTAGSFDVTVVSMAAIVRRAADLGLAIVGQVHTHPMQAFHSGGDFDGMRIRYPGYVSIVLPKYGREFPKWGGAEILMCVGPHEYVRIKTSDIVEVSDCS